jgi:hypothetical protein
MVLKTVRAAISTRANKQIRGTLDTCSCSNNYFFLSITVLFDVQILGLIYLNYFMIDMEKIAKCLINNTKPYFGPKITFYRPVVRQPINQQERITSHLFKSNVFPLFWNYTPVVSISVNYDSWPLGITLCILFSRGVFDFNARNNKHPVISDKDFFLGQYFFNDNFIIGGRRRITLF